MKNKNLLLFIVLSMGLLGIYYALTSRYYPPPPQAQAAIQAAPEPAKVPPSAAPEGLPVASASTDPGSLFSFENADLKLTWRKQDGALLQVLWKRDGTRFFPEETHDAKSNQVVAPAFIGLGGALEGHFQGEPEIVAEQGGSTVVFKNAEGERLSYLVPQQGHILDVVWTSPRGGRLTLIRTLNELPKLRDPRTGEEAVQDPLHGLGRIFSLEEKGITAVAWMSTLKDPWYSFIGGKRSVLPPASRRVGIDAGIEADKKVQQNHFFVAIWEAGQAAQRATDAQPGYHLVPDAAGHAQARLYLGPKHKPELEAFGKPYTQVMDFGFFGLVAKAMFWVLLSIQTVIPNWGWAIVVFSVLLRLALWPLNNKTTIQLLRMKDLEPHQKALQAKYEKFGNDMQKKAEMQKELMAFYKKNGHNPMGGCLPMLLQMPVFFALWSMLGAVFELRMAPWVLWIHNLAGPDKFYVLPILLGVSMIAQQAMTPATGDPAQRKMMMFLMPAMMTFFFSTTPAGLCLYYLVFNLIGMVQTWWVMKNYKSQPVVI